MLEIREEPLSRVGDYARISTAFRVDRILELEVLPSEQLGFRFIERNVLAGWVKDYDAEDGNHPTQWPRRFDMSNWQILSAWLDGQRVGGAVVAFGSPELHMLEGRRDLAVLWDLRVRPDLRRSGVGTALFAACEDWALARACRQLKIETQNINVPACRFYASQACVLGAVHRFAYPRLPAEIQLVWYKDLG